MKNLELIIETQLPASGPGFITYNRGPHGENQWGQSSTIEEIQRIGQNWSGLENRLSPAPIAVGHISLRGTYQTLGEAKHFPPHASHRTGLDFDVRPLRMDGENLPVSVGEVEFSGAYTRKLLETIWELTPVALVLFNDPKAVAQKLCRSYVGHGNHMHVRLRAPGATIREGDRGSDVGQLQKKLGITADGRFGRKTTRRLQEVQIGLGVKADGICGPAMWEIVWVWK